jgi:pimeloyl-ACP methyl ester carboxylesterase
VAPGRRLTVRRWGNDDDPTVVCWPGLNLYAHAQFDEAGPVWAERHGLQVRAVEPPGWTSPPLPAEGYGPRALARLVAPLVAADAAFLGWSWGASIGVHLAALAPPGLRALVLVDAGYTDLQDDPEFQERSIDELLGDLGADEFRFESWDAYLEAARGRVAAWRPALEARARAAMREEDGWIVPRLAPEAFAAALYGVAVERPSEALADIRCPVLLVAATGTLARLGEGPLDRFRDRVPHAEVVTVEGGHDLLADAPEETAELVGSFLARTIP